LKGGAKMRTLDAYLIQELIALERAAGDDEVTHQVLQVVIALARLGEHRTLLRIAAPLLCWRGGEDQRFGLFYQTGRALLVRLAVNVGDDLAKFTNDELLAALGRLHVRYEAARRRSEELENDIIQARRDINRLTADNGRLRTGLLSLETAAVERDAAQAMLRHLLDRHPVLRAELAADFATPTASTTTAPANDRAPGPT
jgi:hypothetical protein